jgi:hypothetical protein
MENGSDLSSISIIYKDLIAFVNHKITMLTMGIIKVVRKTNRRTSVLLSLETLVTSGMMNKKKRNINVGIPKGWNTIEKAKANFFVTY